jgi:hypothetical protein
MKTPPLRHAGDLKAANAMLVLLPESTLYVMQDILKLLPESTLYVMQEILMQQMSCLRSCLNPLLLS